MSGIKLDLARNMDLSIGIKNLVKEVSLATGILLSHKNNKGCRCKDAILPVDGIPIQTKDGLVWPPLLTWFNFNPSMDK